MKSGYYWLKAERSSTRSVAEHLNGMWYLIGESEPVTLEGIELRGWILHKRIKGQDK